MDNPKHRTVKQWWAPVWKGLVMDPAAKHYRKMGSAVWLYLYLLLGANRGTGVLMRKIKTISSDMGVSRDTATRWLGVLRKEGYVATINTGRSLTIQVKHWKPLRRVGDFPLQKSHPTDFSSRKYPTPWRMSERTNPVHFRPQSAPAARPNDTKIQIILNNDMHYAIAPDSDDRAFKTVGFYTQQELLARELATALNDSAGINLYRSYVRKYPEELLRKALLEAKRLPAGSVTRSRGALFTHLVQHYAQGTTENPGD